MMGNKTEGTNSVKNELMKLADKEKALQMMRFFKTGKGEYGEGDIFIGVTVPNQRIIARKHKGIELSKVEMLLSDEIHEVRLTALLIMTYKFPRLSDTEKEKAIQLYLKNTRYINNWDLVDLSAPKLLGAYLWENSSEKQVLWQLAKSDYLWERRIAMLTCYEFIRNNEFDDALKVAKILLSDKHDLIHKAVGWMLREIGKRDLEIEENFLKQYYKNMPRTMLRYAIEKFDQEKKKLYMDK